MGMLLDESHHVGAGIRLPGNAAVVLLMACLAAALLGCHKGASDPGEFVTTQVAQVDGVVLNPLGAPQDSVRVSGRSRRVDAAYIFGVGVTDLNGRFTFRVGRIDGGSRLEPDTLSVILTLHAYGSKYPRAPDGSQLADSVQIVIRFLGVAKPPPIATVEAVFRGL